MPVKFLVIFFQGNILYTVQGLGGCCGVLFVVFWICLVFHVKWQMQ